MRRAPIYLLIDTSGSMTGEPIIAVQNGIKLCIDALRTDAESMEKAHICVITFSDDASVALPLTFVQEVSSVPELKAYGCTSYVAALNKLNEQLEKDIVPNKGEEKGDYKAFVMLLTDGYPTDKEEMLKAVISKINRKKISYFVAATTASDERVLPTLREITANDDYVFFLSSADTHTFQKFFQWVSQSASAAIGSQGIDRGGDDSPKSNAGGDGTPMGELPPLPNFNPDDELFL